jgi:hypothetical protein
LFCAIHFAVVAFFVILIRVVFAGVGLEEKFGSSGDFGPAGFLSASVAAFAQGSTNGFCFGLVSADCCGSGADAIGRTERMKVMAQSEMRTEASRRC